MWIQCENGKSFSSSQFLVLFWIQKLQCGVRLINWELFFFFQKVVKRISNGTKQVIFDILHITGNCSNFLLDIS